MRRLIEGLGCVLVLLALISQLALGSVVVSDDLATLQAATIPCHSGDETPAAPGHAGDHALCPLSVALALPAAILTSPPIVPTPGMNVLLNPRRTAQPRAPPSHRYAAPYPRGPPRLV